jgi:carbamoylphosphate synthase small subunit
MEFAIAIRTVIVRDNIATCQAGAGIVADIHPSCEFEETQARRSNGTGNFQRGKIIMKVVIVDCFDSFTYNLYQLVGALGAEPAPITCNNSIETIQRADPDRIILSPGPGTPHDSGICPQVIKGT